jgi:hypothetical protein
LSGINQARGAGRDRVAAALVVLATVVGAPPRAGAPEHLLRAGEGRKAEKGAWYVPALPAHRLQAVHAVLLPDGLVLIVNGSSNRNRIEKGKILDGVDTTDYGVVDNTALFDPCAPAGSSGLKRIASPETPSADGATHDPEGEANDPFCSGHIHLSDGNVLFVGGTQLYYPGERFVGSRLARIFDWEASTWKPAGRMWDGHWYPTTVPLGDGRVVVLSGLSGRDHRKSGVFASSSWVEIYDPSAPPGKEWSAVDIREMRNSPFRGDELETYPRVYPAADGRLLITGDGTGGGDITGSRSYLMRIGPRKPDGGPPKVRLGRGPVMDSLRRNYSTAVLDPNSPAGDILLLGGMIGTEDINIGPGNPPANPAEMRVTADLRRYHAARGPADVARWETVENALGAGPAATRIMHVATILPTKQILIVGGGNYAFLGPVVRPLLLSPDPGAPGGYRGRMMNPATQPRLYHGVSLLLPDGRVFVAGGNASRAARDACSGSIRLDTTRDRQGTFGFAESGRSVIPAEIWQIEIFSPPYLFIRGKRPKIVRAPRAVDYGETAACEVEHATPEKAAMVLIKLGSVTHGWDMGQRLADLHFEHDKRAGAGRVRFTAPTDRHRYPPGYYMLFYLNDQGKPSCAAMVRLGGAEDAGR